MSTVSKNLLAWIVHKIITHLTLIGILGSLLGLVGFYDSILLYKNLRTSLQELLPEQARSVLDLKKVTSRLETIENLTVLAFSDHPDGSLRWVQDFVQSLENLPRSLIERIDYKLDEEIKFFKQRQALFMDLSDLSKIRDFIFSKIDYEIKIRNPLVIFSESSFPEPKLDFQKLAKNYQGQLEAYEKLPKGYLATQDEKVRAILIYPPSELNHTEGFKTLQQTITQKVHALDLKNYPSDLKIRFSGGIQDNIEEQEALVEDLVTSTVIVLVVVSFAMLLFFKTLWGTFCLVLSLFMGTFWTFGLSYYVVGYLNANTAFLGSIIVGNGVNFGIIVLSRYLEERGQKKPWKQAMKITLESTWTATLTAALAASISYGSLILTDFRGFKQFGIIGLIGMILCWISAITLLPAFLGFFESRGWLLSDSFFKASETTRKTPLWTKAVYYVRWIILVVSIAFSIASIIFIQKNHVNLLETDLTKLRNRESMTSGSGFLNHYTDEIFQRTLSPIILLTEDSKKAKILEKKFLDLKKNSNIIGSVQTLRSFIPSKQEEKIQIFKEINGLLPRPRFLRLSQQDQQLLNSFINPSILTTLTVSNLPALVIKQFTEKNGTVGNIVVIDPPISKVSNDGIKLVEFIKMIRKTADEVSPEIPVVGTLTLSADMIQAISKDGPKATLFAFCAVFLLIIVLFRHFKTCSLILASLGLGVLWLAGLIAYFKLKINFINFIAFPITFGIGVDYGVNIFQRYRQASKKNILEVLSNTGSAVTLCSFSTITGYASLLLARNQGFVSFGKIAILGELTCIIAAVICLPAFLLSFKKLK